MPGTDEDHARELHARFLAVRRDQFPTILGMAGLAARFAADPGIYDLWVTWLNGQDDFRGRGTEFTPGDLLQVDVVLEAMADAYYAQNLAEGVTGDGRPDDGPAAGPIP